MKVGKKIKVCIPIPSRAEGGMYTFMSNFRNWLDEKGIEHTDDLTEQFDLLFVNSWVIPATVVKRIKRRHPHVRVVHRIDGSGRDYGRSDDADLRQAWVNLWADLTIFQSEYSRLSTTQKYKIITHNGPVIYNPVNIDLFKPTKDKFPRLTIGNVSFSTNRKKGTWQIPEIAEQNRDIDFLLCGRYPPLMSLPNIRYAGHLSPSELATEIAHCHLFLNLSENEACPNVVLEALASGLPVLYKSSGGTPELVGDAGLPTDVGDFRQQMEMIWQHYDRFSTLARSRAVAHFAPDAIFAQYWAAIENAPRLPLPTKRTVWQLMRDGYLLWPRRPEQAVWLFKRQLLRWRRRVLKGIV